MIYSNRWNFRRGLIALGMLLLAAHFISGVRCQGQESKTESLAAPITKGQRVFTCGHSFHVFVYDMLREMAKAAGIDDQEMVGISRIGGSRVIQHWDVPDAKNEAKVALRAGKVDVLTLSPIWLPDEGIEKFAKLAVEHNPNVTRATKVSRLTGTFLPVRGFIGRSPRGNHEWETRDFSEPATRWDETLGQDGTHEIPSRSSTKRAV